MYEDQGESSEERQREYEQPRRSEVGHVYAPSNHGGRHRSCTAKFLNGFVNGSVFGATMSGLSAMARATQLQIGFPAAAGAVAKSTIAGGIFLGTGLGVYRGVVCSLQQARGVEDIKNSMLAGGLVGALSEIPTYLRSRIISRADILLAEQGIPVIRPKPRFLTTTAAGSIICGVMYMVESAMRSSPQSQSPQVPQSQESGSQKVAEANIPGSDNWSPSYSQESTSDWVLTNPSPSDEVLESEESDWGTQ